MSAFPPPPAEPPESAPEPPVAPPQTGPEPARTAAAPPRRRRGRTALLLACAALLGTVGGLAGGYTVQADRDPTPLPPLSQAKLAYPKKPLPKGEGPEPLTAEEDRRVRTDGDLRKLLVSKPEGAKEAEPATDVDGWLSLPAYLREFEHPGHVFGYLVGRDVRRVAGAAWDQGTYRTMSVRLVQFRETESRSAYEHAEEQHMYMHTEEYAGNGGTALEGSGNGRYYVFGKPQRKAGYLPVYRARAIAQRGDIMMDIWIFDTKPIGKRDIRSLAERQLERL